MDSLNVSCREDGEDPTWNACNSYSFSPTRNARKDCVYSRPRIKRPDDSRCRSRLVPDRIRGIQRMELEQDPSRQDQGGVRSYPETLDSGKGRLQRKILPRQRSRPGPEARAETSSTASLRRHRSTNAKDGWRIRGHLHDTCISEC